MLQEKSLTNAPFYVKNSALSRKSLKNCAKQESGYQLSTANEAFF